MIQDQEETIERDLVQIANMLLLNGTLTECPGLVHGKMGVAVFFFHYAKYTDNMLFADYAMDLIDEMQKQIHVSSPADFEKGIAGIGIGMDYLIRNNFLIVEDDICEDFDDRMVRAVMYDPWQDFSLYNGLAGYGGYWITRLRYQSPSVQARKCLLRIVGYIGEGLVDIPENEQTDVYCFLQDLHNLKISGFDGCNALLDKCVRMCGLQSVDGIRGFSRLGESAVGNILRMYQCSRYFNDASQDEIGIALKQIPALDMEKAPSGTGLLTGYAGEGMIRLTALKQTDMLWTNLL